MSFWKTMPVVVHDKINEDTFKEIVSTEFLLKKIDNELNNAHLDFEYKIYNSNELNKEFYKNMKVFFDYNYFDGGDTIVRYNVDLYEFFGNNSIIVKFNDKNTKKTIGYIVGKKINLFINGKSIKMLEVSFFCIGLKYRNNHYTPYFINILFREFLSKYKINKGIYSISSNIRSPHYGFKHIYHRPLDIEKLKNMDFLPVDFNDEIYNVYEIDNNAKIVYINDKNVSDDLINIIQFRLKKYQKERYLVYKEMSRDDIRNMFKNKSFHNFLIINEDKSIRDFISLYEVNIYLKNKNDSYKSSSIYSMFFENYSNENIRLALESVSYYCYKKKLLDVLSVMDIFEVDDYYNDLKLIKGEGFAKYYIFNYNMIKIDNYKNGYTII